MLVKCRKTFILLADSIVTARTLASSDCIQGVHACPCTHDRRESGGPMSYFTTPIYKETERVGLTCKSAIWICWVNQILCIMTKPFHSPKGKLWERVREAICFISNPEWKNSLCEEQPQHTAPFSFPKFALSPSLPEGPHMGSGCLGFPA